MSGPGHGDETIGERLRRLRIQRGLSQRSLSEPGVSYAYISRIEAGTRQPSVKALRRLARKLGVSPDYLETGVDLSQREDWEMRLAEAELELRLAGNTQAAETALRRLVEEAETQGDMVARTRALSGLGLAALHRGSFAEAAELLAEVVDSGLVTPALEPETYAFLSRAYAASGRPEKAVALLDRCLEQLRGADGSEATLARFAIYLSYALSDIGETERARQVLSEAISQAEGLTDAYMQVRLYWSQARLAASEGDSRTALGNLRRAVALLESSEDRRQLGRAHLLWAEILTAEGDAGEARPHLATADRLLGPNADAEDIHWLRVEQARAAAELGEAEEAVALARRALELDPDADPTERAAAHWALAKGLALRGDVEEALGQYALAVDLLEGAGSMRRASEVCRDWARLLRAQGRLSEATDVLERASELGLKIGAEGSRTRF